jgi:putative DNA primase/helicase
MQQPSEVAAFLLDKGAAEFVADVATFAEPWNAVISALVAVMPLERSKAFETVCEELGETGAKVQAEVQSALERRFARKRQTTLGGETPAALLDVKDRLPMETVTKALAEEEDGDAYVFAQLFGDQVAYDHSQPKNGWHLWNGQHWEQDTTNAVINLIRTEVATQFVYAAGDHMKSGKDDLARSCYKRAERLHTRRRKEHVLWGAASLPEIAMSGDEWDSNPWLLGVANGVLDLQAGVFRPGHPADWIKSVAPTEWQGMDAECPRWERFLLEIFDGKQELVEFFHRLLGYGITGLNTEHAFPVLWGPQGRNGKTTVLETLSFVLGPDMTMSIPSNELMHSARGGTGAGGPQPFIYKLRGKRVVWSSETNPDRRLDAETVKLLTGGDKIHARAMYANPVEFTPSHLLLLLTNYRPKIEAADNAIWDRVHLVPFRMRFVERPQKENERPRDGNLLRKLREEAPGILAWLVRGCLAWQQAGGLLPPDTVRAATDDYRDEEDSISQFVDEYLVQDSDAQVMHLHLYKAYTKWCKDLRLWASGSRDFGIAMRERFESKRMTAGIFYLGVGLPVQGPAQQMGFGDDDN